MSLHSLVVLTGYETITITSNDFTVVPRHWFNRFVSPPKKGSQCDPQVFNVGNRVFANNSIFSWTIQTIGGSDYTPSVAYSGTSLNTCDVFEIDITVNNETSPGGDISSHSC